MTIGRYDVGKTVPFIADGDLSAARFVTCGAVNDDGNQSAKIPTADSDVVVGVTLNTVEDTETVQLGTIHGAIYQVEVAAAVARGDELMMDVTAAAEGRVKPATSGKRVVGIALEAQALVGERVGVILKDYFKP